MQPTSHDDLEFGTSKPNPQPLIWPTQIEYCSARLNHTAPPPHPPPTHLQVHSRVPVTLVEDDRVCCCQVDAQTTSTRGQQEYEVRVTALWRGGRVQGKIISKGNRGRGGELLFYRKQQSSVTTCCLGLRALLPSPPCPPPHRYIRVHIVGLLACFPCV